MGRVIINCFGGLMNKFNDDKAKAWLSDKKAGYVARLLSIRPEKGDEIKAGNYDQYKDILFWAYTADEGVIVQSELEHIAEVAGLSKYAFIIALGLSRSVVEDGFKGKPIKFIYAAYIKALAADNALLKRVLARTI